MADQPLNALVTKIREAHPGDYDDMDDATLTKRVLAKYPQYSDLAAPALKGPKIDMQQSNTALALNPTDSVATPGEGAYVAQADPQSQAMMAGSAVIGAGGATLAAPGAMAAIRAAAQSHPVVAKLLLRALEGAAGAAGAGELYKHTNLFLKH